MIKINNLGRLKGAVEIPGLPCNQDDGNFLFEESNLIPGKVQLFHWDVKLISWKVLSMASQALELRVAMAREKAWPSNMFLTHMYNNLKATANLIFEAFYIYNGDVISLGSVEKSALGHKLE